MQLTATRNRSILLQAGAVVLLVALVAPCDALAKRSKRHKKKAKKPAAEAPARPPAEEPAKKTDAPLAAGDSKYTEAAMAQLNIARLFYKENKFKQAAVAFHQAYALQKRVEFLFNAARSEQRAMQLDLAAKHFRECLAVKDAPEAVLHRAKVHLGEIEGMQAALRKARESGQKAAETKKPAETKDPAKTAVTTKPVEPVKAPAGPPVGAWKTTAGWSSVAAGALLLGVGGYLAASYSSRQQDLDAKIGDRDANDKVKGIDFKTYTAEQNSLNTTAALGTTSLVFGVAAAGAGAWMLLTAPSEPAQPNITLAPTGARSMVLSLTF